MNDTPAKPYSAACERNRGPILQVLQALFAGRHAVLEIGSGTGQHAVHFAAAMPNLRWQCSDRAENLPGIQQWLNEAALPNTPEPWVLDVGMPWPCAQRFDAVYSANTLHIMAWSEVQAMFSALPGVMLGGARVCVYGPFRYGGCHTSDSNADFDLQLRAGAAHRGVRDFEAVDALARAIGLRLISDVAMPANNRCLAWAWDEPPA